MMKAYSFLWTVILVLTFASCNTAKKKQKASTQQGFEKTKSSTTLADTNSNKEVSIALKAGDDMKFDLSEIRVKSGQTIKLTLKHVGTAPKQVMGHNFVLLKKEINPAAFAQEALGASSTDYIPSGTKDVIAHTKIIGGGETDTVTFTAPAKGTYKFLCSFPGHYSLMQGNFIVE